jgi:hypothetical protein
MRARKNAGQGHGQQAGQAGWQPDRHPAGKCAAHAAQLFTGALHLVQDAAAVGQQQAPGLGGHRAAAVARQQVLPQLDLEQADLAAQRRLCNAQRRRGPREAAEFGYADKVLDLLEVHAPPALMK